MPESISSNFDDQQLQPTTCARLESLKDALRRKIKAEQLYITLLVFIVGALGFCVLYGLQPGREPSYQTALITGGAFGVATAILLYSASRCIKLKRQHRYVKKRLRRHTVATMKAAARLRKVTGTSLPDLPDTQSSPLATTWN